jgi:hypothetical protein
MYVAVATNIWSLDIKEILFSRFSYFEGRIFGIRSCIILGGLGFWSAKVILISLKEVDFCGVIRTFRLILPINIVNFKETNVGQRTKDLVICELRYMIGLTSKCNSKYYKWYVTKINGSNCKWLCRWVWDLWILMYIMTSFRYTC